MNKKRLLLAGLLLPLALSSCTQAWVMEEDEGNLVDKSKIGIEGYDKIIHTAMEDLLKREQLKRGSSEIKLIGWVGLLNKTSDRDTGADIEQASNNTIERMIVQSGQYKFMGPEVMKAVMSEVGVTDINKLLAIAEKRKRFITVLEKQGDVPDYLLIGDLTSASSRGSGLTQKNYQLTFKLIDARSGITYDMVQSKEFRKMYRN